MPYKFWYYLDINSPMLFIEVNVHPKLKKGKVIYTYLFIVDINNYQLMVDYTSHYDYYYTSTMILIKYTIIYIVDNNYLHFSI